MHLGIQLTPRWTGGYLVCQPQRQQRKQRAYVLVEDNIESFLQGGEYIDSEGDGR